MTDTIKEYEGNASTVRFAAPTPYLLASHIRVYVGEPLVETTDFTVDTVTSEVVLTTPPPAPSAPGIKNVRVQRDTPSQPLVDFQSPGAILKADLNTATKQFLYQIEEWEDQFEQDAILDESITQAKLAKPSVDTSELVDLGVTTAKLDDDAVTVGKLAEQAAYTVLANDTAGVANPSHRSIDDLTVLADGSTTRRDLSARAADVINVKDFGAVGDGVTDDTAAVALAYARAQAVGGAILEFPTGDYRFNLDVSGNTTLITFVGVGDVTFRPMLDTPTYPTALGIIYANNSSGLGTGVSTYCVFRNITFTGRWVGDTDGAGQYGRVSACVHLTSSWATFYDCSFLYGVNAGFYSKYGQYNEFYACLFGANVAGAATVGCHVVSNTPAEAANENTWVRCRFNTNKNGLRIEGGVNNRVYGCQFQGTLSGGGAAFSIDDDATGFGASSCIVSGCYFEANALDVDVGVATEVSFVSCSFVGTSSFTASSCYNLSLISCTEYGGAFSCTIAHPSAAADTASLVVQGCNFDPDISGVYHAGVTRLYINNPHTGTLIEENLLHSAGVSGPFGLQLYGGSDNYGHKAEVLRTVATGLFTVTLDAFAAAPAGRTWAAELTLMATNDDAAPSLVGYATRIDKYHVLITCNTSGAPQVAITSLGTGTDTGLSVGFAAIGAMSLGSSVASDTVTFTVTWNGAGSAPTTLGSATVQWSVLPLSFGSVDLRKL